MNPQTPIRSYKRPMARRWFLSDRFYRAYMIREATSLFIGLWCLSLVVGLLRLSQGPEDWTEWLTFMAHPAMILFSLITLAMAVYHSVTWFNAAPKAMPPVIAGKKVKARRITQLHWLGFAIISLILVGLIGWA